MYELMPLFSTPIFTKQTSLDTLDLVEVCEQLPLSVNRGGNLTSDEKHILELPEFANIKAAVLEAVNQYTNEVMGWEGYEYYISLSWANINPTGSSHHVHNHTNSLLSGVYYIRSCDGFIRLHAPQTNSMLSFTPTEYNIWNSSTWGLPVKDNSIVIFPSTTYHSVDPNTSDQSRISIAFNVFLRGTFGNEKEANYLVIN
jgi:uncharacterized protein (TIGR02466 family)